MTINEKTTKSVTVLILDDSISYRITTAEAVRKAGFEVVESTDNPARAVETIKNIKPDIVLFDVILTQLDGLAFLKDAVKVADMSKTHFIAVSSFASDVVVREIMRAGASYYIVKPANYSILTERMAQICTPPSERSEIAATRPDMSLKCEVDADDLERQVTGIILEIGIPAHVKGYHYVRSAILLAIQSADAINAVTKVIYPTIAKQYRTSPSRVERAIRHAIEVAWDRGDVDTLNSFFGYSISSSRGKPTNSEFIAMISDRLRLRNKDGLRPTAVV